MSLVGKDKYVIGLSFGYHDSAAALMKDGHILSAVEEERFTGIKHDNSFPSNSIDWILESNNLTIHDIEVVCYYENPFEKKNRIKDVAKKTFFKNPIGNTKILLNSLFPKDDVYNSIRKYFHKDIEVVYGDHHLSHKAYAYYTSTFKDSAVLTVDGVGEYETTTLSVFNGNQNIPIQSIEFPHSLGMLYSTITAFLGFKPNEGEYKVMGLAPYGTHLFHHKKFQKLFYLTDDGGFRLNMKYFTYEYSDETMFNSKLSELFEIPNRLPEEPINDIHRNIAAALQNTYEFLFFRLLEKLQVESKSKNLCLSGGCAYNGTANGKILERTKFKQLWIPPAPSDAGSAIGALLAFHYNRSNNKRVSNKTPFLGPEQTNTDFIELCKNDERVHWEVIPDNSLFKKVSKLISEGNIIGWVQGKLEFGARALGNRSILADPRDPQMKKRVNMVVKKREGFRPFAPMVTLEDRTKFFNPPYHIPYMNQIIRVHDEHQDKLPAITHTDGSARVQTVTSKFNPRIHRLLQEYGKLTGYPILLNTSFNLKDQTMVRDGQEAIDTFMKCDMDYLVLGNVFLTKKIQ